MSCPTNICFHGCTIEHNATCVFYTGDDLDNIGVEEDDSLKTILEKLNDLEFEPTTFIPVSTNTIRSVVGGTLGHSPVYSVRLNPSEDNMITSSSEGLMVDGNAGGDGKVKIDDDDEKDYLDQKFEADSDDDNILTVTPVKTLGVILPTPSLNMENLLSKIESDHMVLFCSIVNNCAI